MANIALIWELGADLGHVTRMDALARCLMDRGHTPSFALSRPGDLEQIYPAGHKPPYPIFAAPDWPDRRARLSREPANLAEILLALGYHKPSELLQRLRNWQSIFRNLAPDLVIFDYAPTAQLAARNLPCRKICLDDPFSRPPDIFPLPAFEHNVTQQNLLASEAKLLDAVNIALGELALTPIQHAYEIFTADKGFLFSVAELDPFALQRKNCNYVGPAADPMTRRVQLSWSATQRKKIFAYLKPGYPAIYECVEALNETNAEIRLFIPGAGKELLQYCREKAIAVSEVPYDLSDLGACDLVICHGGHATTLRAVLCGIPALIIPLHQEQLCTAKTCINNGLGLGLGPRVTHKQDMAEIIHRLTNDPSFRVNAEACAANHRHQLAKPALTKVADYVDTLL